jgi:osmoprotectant transport system substrate-binding protein
MRTDRLAVAAVATATLLAIAGCGESGSSGTEEPGAAATGAGCAPVAGDTLVVLEDDKRLGTVDNVIPAINAKASSPQLVAALDKVSAALDTPKLIELNKQMDVDRKSPAATAQGFADSVQLTSGIERGTGGKVTVGAANFTENEMLANLYVIVLKAAGYDASTTTIGNRQLYEPQLERGEIQVVPEYVGTLTEFLNKKINGENAAAKASSDLNATVTALKELGGQTGLVFGQPSPAADQNAFAVTTAFADKNQVNTLSEFASKCSGSATVLGGPPECPTNVFCQPGLEQTYGLKIGSFKSLDVAGPLTKDALRQGTISLGLVLSSDGSLAAN